MFRFLFVNIFAETIKDFQIRFFEFILGKIENRYDVAGEHIIKS